MTAQTATVPVRKRPLTQRILRAAGELLLGALSAVAFVSIRRQVPESYVAVQAVAWFALANAAAFVARAILEIVSARHPGLRCRTVHRSPAIGLAAWPVDAWHSLFIDVSIATLAITALGSDVSSGGHWLPWSLVLGLAATWLAVRTLLYLTGSKHSEGLWLTQTGLLVHFTSWGSERVPLGNISTVTSTGNLLSMRADQIERTLCPRLWRGRMPLANVVTIDTGLFGPGSADLAEWVKAATHSDAPAASSPPQS